MNAPPAAEKDPNGQRPHSWASYRGAGTLWGGECCLEWLEATQCTVAAAGFA